MADQTGRREKELPPVAERLRELVRIGAVDPSWTGSAIQAFTPLLMEATDEIERLRAENAEFRAQFRETDEILAEWGGHTPADPPPGWYRVPGETA